MRLEEYEVEFIDLSEEADPFEELVRTVSGRTNADARAVFKREMNADFGVVEGKDYKIDHIIIKKNGMKKEKDYGKYEIGYNTGRNVFFTGQIITASTEKEAIDKYMAMESEAVREDVRANRI